MQPRLNQAQAGRRTLLFVDGSHFVYGAFLGYVWCLVRLFVPTGSGRQRYSVLGALNPFTHRLFTFVTTETITAASVCTLLENIRAEIAGPITLVLDNAPYQRNAKVLKCARRLSIHLLFLPPYSPNLNLIERYWKFLKQRCLNSRVHADFADLQKHVDECIEATNRNEYHAPLNTLLTTNFQSFQDVPTVAA